MNNYVLDFGTFAFDNWWQVWLAVSALVLVVLLNVIPFVCLLVKSIMNHDADIDDVMLACTSLIPLIGMIAGAIFWDKNKTVTTAVFILMFVSLACFIGNALCMY